jgi:hypothetical protein
VRWRCPAARADIWAYVDGQGVTHFAAEPLDERYRLFFRAMISIPSATARPGTGAMARA